MCQIFIQCDERNLQVCFGAVAANDLCNGCPYRFCRRHTCRHQLHHQVTTAYLYYPSPRPVETAAPISLSTYKPDPIMGESPTRPLILKAIPLVCAAAAEIAIRIDRQHANRIMVPCSIALVLRGAKKQCRWYFQYFFGLYSDFFNHSS